MIQQHRQQNLADSSASSGSKSTRAPGVMMVVRGLDRGAAPNREGRAHPLLLKTRALGQITPQMLTVLLLHEPIAFGKDRQ